MIEASTIALDGRPLADPFSVPEEEPAPASLYPVAGAQVCCSVRGKVATAALRRDTAGLPLGCSFGATCDRAAR